MSSSDRIPVGDFVDHLDMGRSHHRAWLQFVLKRLEELDPDALQPGSESYDIWQASVPPKPKHSPAPAPTPGVPRSKLLQVPFFAQMDSTTDQGRRMCFSSSCAMLLATMRPGLITGPNADDQYLARVQKFGDTTDPLAQVRALKSYGLPAEFSERADFAAIEWSIERGVPVPVGYLHRGPVTAPAGGGHWAIVIGYDPDNLILHDPFGEADMVTGATLLRTGKGVRYSRTNFARRWMVEGPGTGWGVFARR